MNKTEFEHWFAHCAMSAVNNHTMPDEYVWDMQNAKEWEALFEKGLTPEAAIDVQAREFLKREIEGLMMEAADLEKPLAHKH